jgi:hypothetical protein
MRFSIRDLLWLTAIAGLSCAWWIDSHRQNAQIRVFQQIAGIESLRLFSDDWEAITKGIRADNQLLSFRVQALKHELETRGHQVEIDGCNVFVDRRPKVPDLFTNSPAIAGQNANEP